MLKKLLLILAFLIPSQIFAISYNGSPTYQIPDIWYNSTIYYNYWSPTWSLQAYYQIDLDTNNKLYQHLNFIKIPGGKSFSGEIFTLKYQASTSDTNAWIRISMYTGATVDTFTYSIIEQDTTILETWSIMEVPHNNVCVGLSWDCVYWFNLTLIAKNTTIGGGLYIPFFDMYYYYNSDRVTVHKRVEFWTYNNTNTNAFTSFLSWFWLNVDQAWRLINYRCKVPTTWQTIYSSAYSALAPTYQYWTWNRSTASLTNDSIIRDFLVWTTTWTTLSAYWTTWINSNWQYQSSTFITSTGSTWTWSTWTWSTWISDSWYTDCGTLEVWCYISSTFSWIFSYFFGDVSINWNWQTYECNSYSSMTGSDISISSGTTDLSFFQRFWNIVSLINPLPPLDWSEVCLFSWETKTVTYQPSTQADIIFILLVIFPILFSFHLIKKKHD